MRLRSTLAFLVCGLLTPLAHADTSYFDFTISGTGITSSGTLTLTSTSNPDVFEITGITGTYTTTNNGGFTGSFTGVDTGSYNSSSPDMDPYVDYDGLFYTDTGDTHSCVFAGHATAGYFDYCGAQFYVGPDYTVDFTGDRKTSDSIVSYDPSFTRYDTGGIVTFSGSFESQASVTPEPGSFALLGTGLLGVAGVVRRRYLKV